MSENITRYPLILFRRSRNNHERLRGTAKESASGHLLGDFEAFLVAQCYSVDINKVKDIEFTAVVHDDQVKFLRRVLEVEPVDDPEWPEGTHFITSGRVPPFLKKIEGRPYWRGLRATKYRGVVLCHDVGSDDVWVEDAGGRVC